MVVGKFVVAVVVAIAISLAASGIHFARRAWMQTLNPSSCLCALRDSSFVTETRGHREHKEHRNRGSSMKMPILLRAALPSRLL